jgi:hypothetical protein
VSSTASDFGCADPRSLLVGILVLAKPPLTPPDIIALGYALRLSATNIKRHLTRLSAEGVLIRTGSRRSQRYSLSAGRGRLVERIAASLAEQPEEEWIGDEQPREPVSPGTCRMKWRPVDFARLVLPAECRHLARPAAARAA